MLLVFINFSVILLKIYKITVNLYRKIEAGVLI